MPVDVYTYDWVRLDVLHVGLLVDQPRSHQVSSFQNELEGALIGCESGVDVRVGVDSFEDGYTVVISENEVQFLIDDDMLNFVVLTCLEFIESHFGLLREDDLYLLFREFRPFYEREPELLDCRFACDGFVTCFLYLF